MKDFLLILPEIILTGTLAFVVIGEITYHGERTRLINAAALFGLISAFVQTLTTYSFGPGVIFEGTLSIDGLALFFKLLFLVLAALVIMASTQSRQIPQSRQAEFTASILASTLASCIAVASTNLLLLFLTLQLLNILGYFISGYEKRSLLSVEAGVKYMIFGSVAGVILLYGVSMLFGFTQSLNLTEIHQALLAGPLKYTQTLVIFMALLLAISFQVGAFPLYQWVPDVLEGAPTPASAYLAVGPRAAGFAIAIRLLIVVFAQPALASGQWEVLGSLDWPKIVSVVSGATMLVGALLALKQEGAKRLVSCLLMVQTGFLLEGVLVLDQVGLSAILYNLIVDLFALVGSYFILSIFIEELGSDRLKNLRGMLGRAESESIALVLFLLCLVGLPPTPGFIGKFTLVGAIVRHQWFALAGVSIISMALSTIAVARLTFHLIGETGAAPLSEGEILPFSAPRRGLILILVLPMIFLGVFANFALDWAGKSLGFILW